MQNNNSNYVRQLTQMAMLAAISVILVYLVHFPIFPAAPFLEYDPADIPLILGAFLYGPVAGLILAAVVCVVQGITVSAGSGPIGIIMHFFATGSYVLLAGFIYGRGGRTVKSAVFAMIAGVAVMCTTMVLWNIVFIPIFMGVPTSAVLNMILPVILPFNLIKSGVNSVAAFLVLRSVGKYMVQRQIA